MMRHSLAGVVIQHIEHDTVKHVHYMMRHSLAGVVIQHIERDTVKPQYIKDTDDEAKDVEMCMSRQRYQGLALDYSQQNVTGCHR